MAFPLLSYAHPSPTHNMFLMICISTCLGCSCLQTPSARLHIYAIECGYSRLITIHMKKKTTNKSIIEKKNRTEISSLDYSYKQDAR